MRTTSTRTAPFTAVLAAVAVSLFAHVAMAETSPRDAALATAKKAIEACLIDDEEAGFRAYLATIHPERKDTDRAVGEIRRYSWARFRKQCRQFIVGTDPGTLEVVRVAPDPVPADATTFKMFFKPHNNPNRMVAPMEFRRDGDRYLIESNSL